jgi:hypothetical protein
VKRFSFKVFISVTVLHIFGTILLIDAGFAELRAMKQAMATGQPEESFLWLTVLCWIWQPIEMFCFRVLHVLSNSYLLLVALAWSLVIGALFAILLPRLFPWRRRTI